MYSEFKFDSFTIYMQDHPADHIFYRIGWFSCSWLTEFVLSFWEEAMEVDSSMELSIPESILLPLFTISNTSGLNGTLEILIETSRTTDGRADLAKKNILPTVLKLSQSLSYPLKLTLLSLSLKLLRNLCAGETENQNSFIEENGVEIISTILNSASDSDYGIIRIGLQVLANVVLAGKEHQHYVWRHFFPNKFVRVARVQKRDTCDPLCMILYSCIDGNNAFVAQLCGDQGLPIVAEILHTTSVVGFGEDWFKLLLSRICLEESHFHLLFSKLHRLISSEESGEIKFRDDQYVTEQAFLLSIISEILNEQNSEITVPNDFALFVLQVLKKAVGVVDSLSRSKEGFASGSTVVNVLQYSLTILRDICALNSSRHGKADQMDIVDALISDELLEVLLHLLRELEPPLMIKKAMKQGESHELKFCPYKGFRRDIVAVVGNCMYRRKNVQDEIRERNGILLLLQQCVTDEDNPFLREWGIWAVRNLLEGNEDNQRVVGELELQGSVDVPEISRLGLRVEVDRKSRRAKLVNNS